MKKLLYLFCLMPSILCASQKLTTLNEQLTPTATDYIYIVANSSSQKAQIVNVVSIGTSTLLSLSSATATYLQLSSVTATYLQLSSATATYLQLSSATTTYAPIAYPTFTGTSTFTGDMLLNNGQIFVYGSYTLIDSNGNINATVIPLSGTAAVLVSSIPFEGEAVYETDTKYVKYGDGSTTVGSLKPINPWLTNGTSIYFHNGHIGVNVSSPASAVDVGTGSITLGGVTRNSWPTSGGSPGGSDRQVQFNSTGSFSAISTFVYSTDGNLGVGTGTPSALISGHKDSPTANQVIFRLSTSDDTSRVSVDEDGDYTGDGYIDVTNYIQTNSNVQANAGYLYSRRNGIGTTSTDGIYTFNSLDSTVGVPVQMSPRLRLSGEVWDTGGAGSNKETHWIFENLPVSGNPPSTNFEVSVDSATGVYNKVFKITYDGCIVLRSPDGTFSKCCVDNADAFSCTGL